METFKMELTVIILIHITAITTSEVLDIFRRKADGNRGWEKGTDSFMIPRSVTGQLASTFMNCARFNAKEASESTDHRSCSCSNDNATLMFNNGEWKCVKNVNVRDLLGFDHHTYIFFHKESKDSQLRMLAIGDKRRRVSIQRDWKNCAVDTSASRYIGCDGVDVSFNSNLFAIRKKEKKYYLKVNSGVSNTDYLLGRIIKLTIKCTKPFVSRNLLFKFEGTLNCSISIPTLQPTVTTKPLDTTLVPTTLVARTTLHGRPETETTHTSTLKSSPVISVTSPNGFASSPTVSDNFATVSDSLPAVSDSTKTALNIPLITVVTPWNSPDRPATVSVTRTTVSVTPSTSSVTSPTLSVPSPTDSVTSPTVSITSTSVFVSPSAVPVPQLTASEIPPDSSVPPPTTRGRDIAPITNASSKVPTHPSSGREGSSGAVSATSLGLISGIASSSLLLIIIIIIIGLLFYRRRKACSSTATTESKDSIMLSPQTNAGYEPDGQNLYQELTFREPAIYASHYKVPEQLPPDETLDNKEKQSNEADTNEGHFYAPLNIPQGHNIYGLGNAHELDSEKIYQNYGSICIEQPVYNLLEELSTAEGSEGPLRSLSDRTEPVYNVLEGPYIDGFEDPDHYGTIFSEEPVYSSLERPYKGSAEESNYGPQYINEPIYNILEDGPYLSISAEDEVYYGNRVL